ncbi:hypothetical protein DM860_002530 [Cuscuta australis]|uniref:Uncharacterized protein n=1 Tax=Cuscuta australis TaxID=267555 RepID=A0A328CYL8_9ASTE|nr:hypothetical protein DM860_002530 [Cuscuta australis]
MTNSYNKWSNSQQKFITNSYHKFIKIKDFSYLHITKCKIHKEILKLVFFYLRTWTPGPGGGRVSGEVASGGQRLDSAAVERAGGRRRLSLGDFLLASFSISVRATAWVWEFGTLATSAFYVERK